MPSWKAMNMQDPNSPSAQMMIILHNSIMIMMIIITVVIMAIMMTMITNKSTSRKMLSNNMLETTWTILPMVILMIIGIPSIKNLYWMEEDWNPTMSIKSIGHQWYWSYEYPELNIMFDSYMKTEMSKSSFRLLEVDNRMIIPVNQIYRMIITSSDVIHSWAIPSMGIKMDAIPGRLNQCQFSSMIMGISFGQCSEICGMNHSFMPICVETVSSKTFIKWIKLN